MFKYYYLVLFSAFCSLTMVESIVRFMDIYFCGAIFAYEHCGI